MPLTNDYRIPGERPYTSPSPPPPKPKTRILSLFLVGVIMFSISFLFLVLIGIASVLLLLPLLLSSLHRHHRRRHRNRRHDSSDGLSSRFVKKLPQFKFSEATTYIRCGSDCVVCFDGFRQGQWCRNLPGCGHVFHRKCVDTWLLKASTCPICRARVRLKEEDAQEGELRRCFSHRRRSFLDL